MTTISDKDLKSKLDAVLSSAQHERIVISRDGKPCAVLIGIAEYDAEDMRLATSSDFWRMIRGRRTKGKSLPLAEVESRLQGQDLDQSERGAMKKTNRKRARP